MRNFCFFFFLISLFISCNENRKEINIEEYFQSDEFNSQKNNIKKQKLDSIYNFIKSNSNDSISCENFLLLSTEYYYISDGTFSRKSAKKALNVSLEIKDTLKQGTSLYYIAETFKNESKDSAYFYYSLANKNFQNLKNYERSAKIIFKQAYLLFYDGNYIDCEAKLVDALRKSENTKDYKYRYSYLTLMGNCQEKLGNFDLALRYHEEAIKVLDKINDKREAYDYKVSSIINMSNAFEKSKNYDKTINTLTDLLKEKGQENISKRQQAIIINNLAYAKMKKGDFNGVEKDFLEALKISEEINNNNEILYRKVNLGEFYLTVGSINKLEVYLKDALDLSKRIGNYNEYLKSLKFLAKVDLQNKDFYNDEYVRVKDSITTAQLTNREKYARIEYETSKLEEENEKLTQQNLIILLASLFVTALFILIVLYTRLNSQKNENKLLSDKQKAESEMITLLEESRKNIEKTKINEQNRISKELHDGVLNDLYGIRLNLDFMVSSLDNELSSETETYIDGLLKVEDDIRKISHDLKIEEKFEKSEFKSLIDSLVEDKNEIHNINFSCEIDNKIDWSIFTTSDKLNIYRIIQEATQNVIKHSNASNCNISFRTVNNNLRIIIEDNGVGYNLEGNTDGIGLKNIKERVGELKGEVYFEKYRNEGLKINVLIKR